MIENDKIKEAKLEYPREWDFTIIGRDKEKIEKAIKEVLANKEYKYSFSKSSKNGKFQSYSASCEVASEQERDELYKKFSNHNNLDYIM
jgi:putative lipoic acid-binding regulatory protein